MWCAEIPVGEETKTFEFGKWGAEEQTDILLDVMSIAGSSLGSVADLLAGGGLDASLSSKPIENIMRQLSQGLTRDKTLTKRIIKKLCSEKVLCNGANIKYDQFYAEHLATSFLVCKANLEVQYGDFLGAVASLLPAQPTATTDTAVAQAS